MAGSSIMEFQGPFRFLSNFWKCPQGIRVGQRLFDCVEIAYQFSKTLEPLEQSIFLQEGLTAGQAKRLGRDVTLRPHWMELRIPVMTELVRQKFDDPHLAELLTATHPRLIFEGNNWQDRFWGIDLKSGKGDNHLGQILMTERAYRLQTKTMPA